MDQMHSNAARESSLLAEYQSGEKERTDMESRLGLMKSQVTKAASENALLTGLKEALR